MSAAHKFEHADKVESIAGVSERLTIRRHLEGYSYPQNGNVHNPTPRYMWLLLVDGYLVDSGQRRREMVEAARSHGAEYIAEVDAHG